LNYFSCKLTGDSRIWLEDVNHKIRAQNDDYSWGDETSSYASRINDKFNMTISALLVSSYGSYNPTGNCDLYMACLNADERKYGIWPFRKTVCDYFPNLDADDAIEAQVDSDIYNCASWAGGIERGWFWGYLYDELGGSYMGLPFGSATVWSTWDDYFSNDPYDRYIGATNFTRTGATSANADIAVWPTNGQISGVTHFSVRNDANNHAHGYEWESKPGTLARFFHPRDALEEEDGYGSIFDYYIKDTNKKSGLKNLTFNESIELGLTIIEDLSLSYEEKSVLSTLKTKKSDSTLNVLFGNWLESHYSPDIIIHSNPIKYISTQEGNVLINYCKENEDKAFAFLSEKVFSKTLSEFQEHLTTTLICGITNRKYANVMEEIINNWENNCFTENGEYLAPLTNTIGKRYIKNILKSMDDEEVLTNNINKRIDKNNLAEFRVFPNPINTESSIKISIEEASCVSINIYDLKGTLVKTIIDDIDLTIGTYSYRISQSSLESGVYLCKLFINNKSQTRKFVVL
jgi:hypothetical protein